MSKPIPQAAGESRSVDTVPTPTHVAKDQTTRILIVDDHPFFSGGLAQVLRREGLAGQVATANCVATAMADLRRHPDTALILLDLSLPDQEGLVLLRELNRIGLPIPVVVISSREDEAAIRSAEAAGASGFLFKSADTPALSRTLQRIRAGHTCFPRRFPTPCGPPIHLTLRQREVLDLLAAGLPNKRICQKLALSEDTVKSHIKTLFASLDVHNRTECVGVAREIGLLD